MPEAVKSSGEHSTIFNLTVKVCGNFTEVPWLLWLFKNKELLCFFREILQRIPGRGKIPSEVIVFIGFSLFVNYIAKGS